MKSLVAGLVMLASSMLRGPGVSVDDDVAMKLTRARETLDLREVVAEQQGAGDPAGAFSPADVAPGGERHNDDTASITEASPRTAGEWQVACELKSGSLLFFDRGSVRDLGPVTLVRWAAPADTRTQNRIFTALVSCGEKTIEASWPGKRSQTHVGTCGRHLVEAVCEIQKENNPAATAPDSPAPRARSSRASHRGL